ncbi:nitric oxide reductase activation protein NorD [Hydrogenophaga sp.]|uniref:nitric oxide reductase activation protein NorD n=1 Tax=Hydrogenophaga sp. TaxID=1904254 RepID=UPI00261B5731|nr:nitric oxide reductase activation protein NorD [Hydrogenophaga sp.]MCW5654507.1 nitric oxide reductase activation protein NorD [Hydrogenophaga sp.]
MPAGLEEHAERLAVLDAPTRERLARGWPEAARVLSGRGLEHHLGGVVALHNLGRGVDVVNAWIDAAPQVARETGEDVLPDLAAAAMQLASKTSGAVIGQVLASAPTAARRLADADLFRQYLRFLATLAAQAPRGLRPMLEQLDVLLGQLTLGGLRRWANWGAQAHRAQFDEQVRYFGLQSPASLSVLQQERKGTLLVDVQRRLGMYLRALWGRDFFLRPTAGDFEHREGLRPFIEDHTIHLPDALDAVQGVDATSLYRAAAAHAAAHLVYTRMPLRAPDLDPWQKALVAQVEDARVEALAIARFPGLQNLWCRLLQVAPVRDQRAADWLDRLARALIDPACTDTHPWIVRARALWQAALPRVLANPGDPRVSWELGLALAQDYPGPNYQPRHDVPGAAYRDDNRFFWAFDGIDFAPAGASAPRAAAPVRRQVSVMAFINELDVETAGEDAQEIWVLGSELFPYEDLGVSWNTLEGRPRLAPPVLYPEWDHRVQIDRPSWVTVQERHAVPGDTALVDAIASRHRPVVARMKRVLDAMRPQGVLRMRKQEDGDEVDLNAALASLVELRRGAQPDPRVMVRSVRQVRDLAVLVLLDLSQSTNDPVPGQDRTVLDLTREACVLLADAIHQVGDPFAIHGFCSDGRHDVSYWRFKDFQQPWADMARARLAGMRGQLSTRMGAAIRHATALLERQPAARRLLLVVTDGEPADVDERDPAHLRQDAKKAVEAAARVGVQSFCMSLDPRADAYVSQIFGARRYQVVDRVERLPEKLPMLYAGLAR